MAACRRVDGRLVVLAGAMVVRAGARARAGAKVNTSSARRLGRGMVRCLQGQLGTKCRSVCKTSRLQKEAVRATRRSSTHVLKVNRSLVFQRACTHSDASATVGELEDGWVEARDGLVRRSRCPSSHCLVVRGESCRRWAPYLPTLVVVRVVGLGALFPYRVGRFGE